jgi:hypothetical protein
MRHTYKYLVGETERKRPLRRLGHRGEDNIRMVFMAVGLEVVDWMNLAQGSDQWQSLVNMEMSLRIS